MSLLPADLAVAPEGITSGWLDVAGTQVRWHRRTGDGPPIVLLHGGGANATWWFGSIPHFGSRELLMVDFSGHGDSGRRVGYTLRGWANEVAAVMEEFVVGDAVIVCHSMSGRVGVLLSAMPGVRVRSLVLVDTVIPTHAQEPVPAVQPSRLYPAKEEAVERFRFVPPAPEVADSVRRRIGEHSVTRTPNGWTWKFDPNVFEMPDAPSINPAISAIRCPVGLLVASESTVSTLAMGKMIADRLGTQVETRLIEGVGHHLMLEQPDEVAAVILEIIDTLDSQSPMRLLESDGELAAER